MYLNFLMIIEFFSVFLKCQQFSPRPPLSEGHGILSQVQSQGITLFVTILSQVQIYHIWLKISKSTFKCFHFPNLAPSFSAFFSRYHFYPVDQLASPLAVRRTPPAHEEQSLPFLRSPSRHISHTRRFFHSTNRCQ